MKGSILVLVVLVGLGVVLHSILTIPILHVGGLVLSAGTVTAIIYYFKEVRNG